MVPTLKELQVGCGHGKGLNDVKSSSLPVSQWAREHEVGHFAPVRKIAGGKSNGHSFPVVYKASWIHCSFSACEVDTVR